MMNNTVIVPTIDLLKEALGSIGYSFQSWRLDSIPCTLFTAPTGQKWLTPNARINYPLTTSTARLVSVDKKASYDLAEKLGFRSPKTVLVDPLEYDAQTVAKLLEQSLLVVKPNAASLSHGLTINISTVDQLDAAITLAAKFGKKVLVQEQFDGQELRFAVLNNKVCAALLRQTPRIIGDGIHTVEALLEQENEARKVLPLPYRNYPSLHKSMLNLTNIDLNAVPPKDTIVELSKATMISYGASMYNVLDQVHPSYLPAIEELARNLGSGFVVVDVMLHDYSQPKSAENHTFIEFNTAPVLALFYSCRDGKQFDVLSKLVPMINAKITSDPS